LVLICYWWPAVDFKQRPADSQSPLLEAHGSSDKINNIELMREVFLTEKHSGVDNRILIKKSFTGCVANRECGFGELGEKGWIGEGYGAIRGQGELGLAPGKGGGGFHSQGVPGSERGFIFVLPDDKL
jgi:hypothetical protein